MEYKIYDQNATLLTEGSIDFGGEEYDVFVTEDGEVWFEFGDDMHYANIIAPSGVYIYKDTDDITEIGDLYDSITTDDSLWLRVRPGNGIVPSGEVDDSYLQIVALEGTYQQHNPTGGGETMTTKLTPSAIGSDYSHAGIPSSYALTNVIGKDSSASVYGGINLNTGSNAVSYFFLEFDASGIPANAVISSITAKVKVYNSSNAISRTSTRQVQLYSGNTAKGSAESIPTSGSQVLTIGTPGTWTRAELDDLKIRCYYKRNSSSPTTSTQVYVQGADITIEYTEKPMVKHTLTITANGHAVTPSGGEYDEGTIIPITITEDPLPKVTLDGTEITSQFAKQSVEGSTSGAPTASTTSGVSSSAIAAAVGHTAENPTNGSAYYGSRSAAVDSQYAQYTFDVSGVPTDATDIKVACRVAGIAESTTYSHQSGGRYSVWGLCCNGTAKGDQIHATSTSTQVLEFANTGSWTRSELNGLQLRHYVGYYGGATRGVTLTITYKKPGGGTYVYNLTMDADHALVVGGSTAVLYVKRGGQWVAAGKVFRKEQGAWVEIDPRTIFGNAASGSWSGFVKGN